MAIRPYLTELWLSGGASNTDPDASLGGSRSTAAGVEKQSASVLVPMAGITIIDVWVRDEDDALYIQRNTSGVDGKLGLVGAPGVAYYAGLDINGLGASEDNYITGQDGSDYWVAWVYATIVKASLPAGPADGSTFAVTTPDNNLFGLVSTADFAADEEIYRCIYIKNENVDTLTGFTFEPVHNGSGFMDVGLDPAGVNGTATTIADQYTAPAGVSFIGTESIPDLDTGEYIAIWIRLTLDHTYMPPARRSTGYFKLQDSAVTSIPYSFAFIHEGPVEATSALTFSDVTDLFENMPSDQLTFSDSTKIFKPLTDFLGFSDEVSFLHRRQQSDEDAFTLSDETDGHVRKRASLSESIVFSSEESTSAVFHAALIEQLVFNDLPDYRGGVFEGWVVNVESSGTSRYSWLGFNSFAEYNGHYYGATPEGVYLLEGEDDAGTDIEAFVLSRSTDFGVPVDKHVLEGYVNSRGDNNLLFKTVIEDLTVYTYDLSVDDEALARRRVSLGRGASAVYWQFAIQNFEGGDFEADSFSVYVAGLKRRFR